MNRIVFIFNFVILILSTVGTMSFVMYCEFPNLNAVILTGWSLSSLVISSALVKQVNRDQSL